MNHVPQNISRFVARSILSHHTLSQQNCFPRRLLAYFAPIVLEKWVCIIFLMIMVFCPTEWLTSKVFQYTICVSSPRAKTKSILLQLVVRTWWRARMVSWYHSGDPQPDDKPFFPSLSSFLLLRFWVELFWSVPNYTAVGFKRMGLSFKGRL